MHADPTLDTGDGLDRLPDDATGRWSVVTSSALYVLDLDREQARRIPAAELADPAFDTASLRGDYTLLPLLAVERCELGWPLELVLSVAPPAVTLRRTTPVRMIRRLP